jgi:hypothetical protein
MAEKKTSAARVLISLGSVLAFAAFYVAVGHDWFFNGRMLLCTHELTMDKGSWCFRPPRPECSGVDCIDETYRGQHQWFNDDIVGYLFGQMGLLFGKWFTEFKHGVFWGQFARWWNGFFQLESRRLAFGIVVAGLYAAFVSKVVGSFVDWIQGK